MKLHLVGGFLGSGKTTAIISASRSLMARGVRVGVITNDQGKYLVDTAFVRLSDLPAVEVTGGCFCCNYDDLHGRLDEIVRSAQPQVVFAESVGSCADLVATVVKPLLAIGGAEYQPSSFSVLADARLLLRRWQGEEMPFSDDVAYIFDQQIEEAGLLVINKSDLLAGGAIYEIEALAKERLNGKPYLLQSSRSPEGVWAWLNLIQSGKAPIPDQSLQIDYARYASGEAALAWVDQEFRLLVPAGQGRRVLVEAVRALTALLSSRQAAVGHLKWMARAGDVESKGSVTTIEQPGWEEQVPHLPGEEVDLLFNARVELPAGELRELIVQAFSQVGAQVTLGGGDAFHPKAPKPTHRMG